MTCLGLGIIVSLFQLPSYRYRLSTFDSSALDTNNYTAQVRALVDSARAKLKSLARRTLICRLMPTVADKNGAHNDYAPRGLPPDGSRRGPYYKRRVSTPHVISGRERGSGRSSIAPTID